MIFRTVILITFLSSSAYATSDRYIVQCSKSCTVSDGTVQPAGTNINRILADPKIFNPGANLTLVPDTGQLLYASPAVPPTTISALDFIRRFTSAEQIALQTANPLWGLQIAAAGIINVNDPTLLVSMQQAVSQSLLTQARMNQVLNLSVTSP